MFKNPGGGKERMDEVAAAARELHKAILERQEPWRWRGREREAEARRARQRLERASKEGREAALDASRGTLQILEACLGAIARASAGDERMTAYLRSWQREVPPRFLMERLRRIDEALTLLSTGVAPGVSRRGFLAFAGKAAAGIAAAQLAPGAIREALAGSPDNRWWLPGKLYLQLGAFSRTENASRIGKRFPALNIRYYPQLHAIKTGKGEEEHYWYHVIVDRPFERIPEAMEFLYEEAIDVKEAGIIGFYEDGRTMWVKTPEEKIIEEAEKLIEEVSTRIEDPRPSSALPYHDLVVAAVQRYPLTGDVGWDASLVHGVKRVESNNDPDAGSEKGAKGLMQLMPKMFNTFHHWSILYHPVNWNLKTHLCRHPRPKNPEPKEHACHLIYDPEQNIDAGTHQLYYLFQRYYRKADRVNLGSVKLILRYYNGGETRVRKGKLDDNEENLTYPAKVLNRQADYAP